MLVGGFSRWFSTLVHWAVELSILVNLILWLFAVVLTTIVHWAVELSILVKLIDIAAFRADSTMVPQAK
jgi:hypothetical protein